MNPVESTTPIPAQLPPGTRIDDFIIDRVLGGGGFAIVYRAQSLHEVQDVVIKEYFPAKLAKRDDNSMVCSLDESTQAMFLQGRKLFFQEASVLASLEHPNIASIIGFFHANGTVYTAMRYDRGVSLYGYIKRKGGRLPEERILSIILPVLDCLRLVHSRGLLHLDIKPGNIYLRQDAGPMLLDFGAVRKLARSASSHVFPIVTHGFSPIEQSRRNVRLGPWTDLYALGATVRACIEAKAPPSARDRMQEETLVPASTAFAGEYSPRFLVAIDFAMMLHPAMRPQTVDDFLAMLPNP